MWNLINQKSVSLNTHSGEVFIVDKEVSCSQKDACSRTKKKLFIRREILFQNVAVPNTASYTLWYYENLSHIN